MPVEIRELVIKANISESSGSIKGSSSSGNPEEIEELLRKYKQQIIAECMDQVFDLLKEKNKR